MPEGISKTEHQPDFFRVRRVLVVMQNDCISHIFARLLNGQTATRKLISRVRRILRVYFAINLIRVYIINQ